MRVLGISRSACFSPNSVERDNAIFTAVASLLKSRGCDVATLSEDGLSATLPAADIIFGMARSAKALNLLAEAEEQGTPVINSPWGIASCERCSLTTLFEDEKIPAPQSSVISIGADPCFEGLTADLKYPCWLKRGGSCAQRSDDVSYVSSPGEMSMLLHDFRKRGISRAVVAEHLEGDLVKFYGVEGTAFFYFTYPTDGSATAFSKFGKEKMNGRPQKYVFSAGALKQLCDKIAGKLRVPVYGGDCIVNAEGAFKIIDFNDWPSFSCCRENAAPAIAERICRAGQNEMSIYERG